MSAWSFEGTSRHNCNNNISCSLLCGHMTTSWAFGIWLRMTHGRTISHGWIWSHWQELEESPWSTWMIAEQDRWSLASKTDHQISQDFCVGRKIHLYYWRHYYVGSLLQQPNQSLNPEGIYISEGCFLMWCSCNQSISYFPIDWGIYEFFYSYVC